MKKTNQHRWFLGAGLLSAMVASLCCIGPVVMLALGLGSFAAASWFAAWRPVFLVVTFGFLAAGWFITLRSRRVGCADGACATPRIRLGGTLLLLSLATLGAAGFAAYPWYAGRLAKTSDPTAALPAGTQTLRVRIPAMDCQACATGIAATLRREPGILDAEITYATKDAVVRFDPDATDIEKIIAAIDATGFKATPPPDA